MSPLSLRLDTIFQPQHVDLQKVGLYQNRIRFKNHFSLSDWEISFSAKFASSKNLNEKFCFKNFGTIYQVFTSLVQPRKSVPVISVENCMMRPWILWTLDAFQRKVMRKRSTEIRKSLKFALLFQWNGKKQEPPEIPILLQDFFLKSSKSVGNQKRTC